MTRMSGSSISLRAAAERLGLHYMTIYRYVRTGRLAATKRGGQWYVDVADLDGLVIGSDPAVRDGSRARAALQLEDRMIAADEPGAWSVVSQALTSGAEPADIHLQMLIPAMQSVGDRWARGDITVFDEHQATVVATRLAARLGPRFRLRAAPKAHVVVGLVCGDTHALTTAIMADLLRGGGYEVTDLGADTPPESFVEVIESTSMPLAAVAISSSMFEAVDAVHTTVQAIRASRPDLSIAVGGAGIIDREQARAIGDTVGASDIGELVLALDLLTDDQESLVSADDEQAFGVPRRR